MHAALALAVLLSLCGAENYQVQVDFDKITGVSKTVTTLQVVSNPILDREFKLPNGTTFKNPIHDQCWASLADLGADLVRFVPWFPYPKKSVAELDPPAEGKPTSWDFSDIIPQFFDFMAAVLGKNHSTVINFSTQPCWLFGDKDGKPQNCSYPANPDQTAFDYVRGNRANLLDPTSEDLAAYYARLLSWMILGEFTDENGVKHTGGPKFDLSRAKGHVWELFNEGEHGYNSDQYIHDYDVVVTKMIEAVGEEKAPAFMGIGGASLEWVAPFLNRTNHGRVVSPIDYVSIHFYATCANRTDPETYAEFFGDARGFALNMPEYLQQRDRSSFPKVKFDLDELGVIMPDDNDPSYDITASLPSIYWNAAGAMYAFLYAHLAPLGVEVLGHSQLAGSPKIPEWNIPLPQYPSVSLLDWRTGYGNARYWVLKLLLLHFGVGDQFVQTNITAPPPRCNNNFCGEDGADDGYATVTLHCCDPKDTITEVVWADYGTVKGSCGSYESDKNCTKGVEFVKDWVAKQCVGNSSCDLTPLPVLGDPCYNIAKRFVAQVSCSGRGGYSPTLDQIMALGIRANGQGQRKDKTKKLLLINTRNVEQTVTVTTMGSASLYIVDSKSVQEGSLSGIRNDTLKAGQAISMLPFSVIIADFA